jgi:hypothetical protein
MKHTEHIHVTLTPEMAGRLKRAANAMGIPILWMLRRCLERDLTYCERLELPRKMQRDMEDRAIYDDEHQPFVQHG